VDGLSGRLLGQSVEDPEADKWDVLSLPAVWEAPDVPQGKQFWTFQKEKMLEGIYVNEEDPLEREGGEALWPEKHDREELESIRAVIGGYNFAALYQQQPYQRSGGMFKREYFPIVDRVPEEEIVARVRCWDLASTAGGGAYTSGELLAKTEDNYYYVEHVARGQWSEHQRNQRMIETGKNDQEERGYTEIWLEREPGSSGKDQAAGLVSDLADAGLTAYSEPATGSKEVRAGPWSSKCEAGRVFVARGGWNEAYIEEHIAFPNGKYKDQVDSSSLAFEKLRQGVLEGDLLY